MIAHASSLTGGASLRAQEPSAFLRVVEGLRWEAARVMSAAFPGDLDAFAFSGLPASTLSRARNGSRCSALWRVDLLLAALSRGGAPREQAQLLADHVQDTVERFYGGDAPDPYQLSLMETRWQAASDPLQMAFQGGDQSVRLDLVDRLRAHRAAVSALILALLTGPASAGRRAA